MGPPSRCVELFLGVAALAVASLGAVSCSSDVALSADQRADAASIIDQRVAQAMIELSERDRECVLDRLEPDDLVVLQAADPVLEPAAAAVVDCVGSELIGSALLHSQVGAVSTESLDCAVGELDGEFVVELVAGAMDDRPPQATAEVAVARALGVCLELDELLDQ